MNQDFGTRYDFVGTVTNAETGEVVPAVVKKTTTYGKLRFSLVDRRTLFDLMLKLDGCSKDVLCVILRGMKDYTNVFDGTFKSIQDQAHIGAGSVIRAMDELQKYDIIRMIRRGQWAVNPALCGSTDSEKHKGQLYWYSTLETKADRSEKKNDQKEDEESNVLRYSENGMEEGTQSKTGSDIYP